jgi:hypothetical protein
VRELAVVQHGIDELFGRHNVQDLASDRRNGQAPTGSLGSEPEHNRGVKLNGDRRVAKRSASERDMIGLGGRGNGARRSWSGFQVVLGRARRPCGRHRKVAQLAGTVKAARFPYNRFVL